METVYQQTRDEIVKVTDTRVMEYSGKVEPGEVTRIPVREYGPTLFLPFTVTKNLRGTIQLVSGFRESETSLSRRCFTQRSVRHLKVPIVTPTPLFTFFTWIS